MKSFKFLFLLLSMTVSSFVNSQTVNGNLFYSTGNTHIAGVDVYLTFPSNFVVGVGGTHATKTFFTSEKRNGNDYTDANYNLAPLPLPMNNYKIVESFTENRGNVSGIIGYSLNKKRTTVLCDMGIGFTQKINLLSSATATDGPLYPKNTLAYQSFGGSLFTYGGSVTQKIKQRFGVMIGYNNVQKFKFGVNYRLTP